MSSYSSIESGDNTDLSRDASKNYLLCYALASALGMGIHGLEQFPGLLGQIITRKAWYNLYIEPTHQYIKFDKYRQKNGTLDDRRNFIEFVTTLPPEGLGTTLAKIELLIKDSPDAREIYHALVYASRQGERIDLVQDVTAGIEFGKLKSARSQQQYRAVYGDAASGRIGAPPLIKELFKQGLINLNLAAKMGVCNPNPELSLTIQNTVLELHNLVDNNPTPTNESERKALRKAINLCVSQGLSLERKPSLFPTNPEKAAILIGKHYQGERRQKLIEFLQQLPD